MYQARNANVHIADIVQRVIFKRIEHNPPKIIKLKNLHLHPLKSLQNGLRIQTVIRITGERIRRL